MSKFTPPMRNGVTASQLYLNESLACACSLYQYLCKKFPHISPNTWQERFEQGLVYAENGDILTLQSPYIAHQRIFYYRNLDYEIPVPFDHHILFENEHFIAVDKPHFLTVSPTGNYVQQTLLVRLKQQFNNPHLTPIHRLDRETAGVVLFSKKPESRGIYQQLFAEHHIQKTYHCIAPYLPTLTFPMTLQLCMQKSDPFYTMQINDDGIANSETWIDILAINQTQTLAKYILKPKTGKQHQLRVHLNHLGIAIINDPLYPTVQHKTDGDFQQPLQLLAKQLEFIDPISQEHHHFSSTFDLHCT